MGAEVEGKNLAAHAAVGEHAGHVAHSERIEHFAEIQRKDLAVHAAVGEHVSHSYRLYGAEIVAEIQRKAVAVLSAAVKHAVHQGHISGLQQIQPVDRVDVFPVIERVCQRAFSNDLSFAADVKGGICLVIPGEGAAVALCGIVHSFDPRQVVAVQIHKRHGFYRIYAFHKAALHRLGKEGVRHVRLKQHRDFREFCCIGLLAGYIFDQKLRRIADHRISVIPAVETIAGVRR